MPQLSEENRRKSIRSELESIAKRSGEKETLRVPWKSGHEICPVIEVSLDAVVLNPGSHRIRAQIESHPEKEMIDSDPFGEATQHILAELIRSDESFEDLKLNLKEETQRDAGVITRSGLLVNANRRAVALRELGAKYIRVGVLPENVGNDQLAELELRLQMTRDLKQEYTFTNQLLFVEELRSRLGFKSDQIALLLRYAQSSDAKQMAQGVARVDRDTRLLIKVRELQALSMGQLPYDHFDGQRISLIELDEAYEKLRKDDPIAADRLQKTRFVGIVAQAGYKNLRPVDSEFFENYLRPSLEEDEELNQLVPLDQILEQGGDADADAPEGLDLLDVEGADEGDSGALESFVEWFASLDRHLDQSKGDVRSIKIPREHIRSMVRASLQDAADQAKADAKKENRIEAPTTWVSDARAKIQRATNLLPDVIEDSQFDVKKFEFKLKKLEKATALLRETYSQCVQD